MSAVKPILSEGIAAIKSVFQILSHDGIQAIAERVISDSSPDLVKAFQRLQERIE